MKITRPTLILDKRICLHNIEMMVNKAKKHKLRLRPHFKTHQSLSIGKWFRDLNIHAITVSSVKMAKHFADNSWGDITVAFPINILEIDDINKLAQRINLNLVAVSVEPVLFLNEHLKHNVNIFIKIDTGYGRTGIPSTKTDEINSVLNVIEKSPVLAFKGFLSHSGHTYQAKSKEEISKIHEDSLKQLLELKNLYSQRFPALEISIGDTPSCSLMDNFSGIDEIRPGNFVFYDMAQQGIGSCTTDQIAVAMACPVVAKHKDRNEIVIYGGGVHFSKEYLLREDGSKFFGKVVKLEKDKWTMLNEDIYISSLSQEHGIIKTTDNYFENSKIGDIVGVLPIHSCLTADLMKGYLTFENEYIDHMSKSN